MPNATNPDNGLGHAISTADYNIERLQPDPSQELYLTLVDLRLALEGTRTDRRIAVLDYGCGGSPYAELFPNADYKRADFLQTGRLDYVLSADSRVPEGNGFFDMILSTQVLEHVEGPDIYLSECHRLLKPGGTVVLTTHGTFPEHGCPYDYQRWTADGLRIAFERSGFRVVNLKKLTTGPRALFFLLESSICQLYSTHNGIFRLCLKAMRICLARARAWIHRQCDRHFADHRLVDPHSNGDNALYIGLFIVAEKV